MTTTLATLTTLISRKRGDLEEFDASSSGSTTTLICNQLCIGGDNEYAGDELLFIDRATVIARRVISSVISTYTLTFAPALSTLVASGESFEKRRKHMYADVIAAINSAITELAPVAPQLAAPNITLTMASGTYEYTIPATFTRIYLVEINADSAGNYQALAPLQWDVRPGGKLWIAPAFADTYTGHTIRLSGYTDPATLSTRSAATPLPVPYILAYADWYLYGQLPMPDPKMLDTLFKTKEYERARSMTQTKPNTKSVLP